MNNNTKETAGCSLEELLGVHEPSDHEAQLLSQLRKRIEGVVEAKDEEFLEDKNLVRWLRARNCSVEDAETMFRNHLKWRKEWDIDTLADSQHVLPEDWRRFYRCSFYGCDPHGSPINLIEAKTWEVEKGLKAGLKETILQHLFALQERTWRLCLHNSRGKSYIPQCISIYDLSDVSVWQICSPEGISATLAGVRGMDVNYPESLNHIFVLHSPWVLMFLWKVISPVLAGKTRERISFLGSNRDKWRDEISKTLPTASFPSKYGGDGADPTHPK